ncbi:MAG TPA: hypothetical protein VKA84_22615 [Gemmatimonadaceae bacterium]|nr:hypothetical protein [Gemmatimonadaceae bacterium]
MTTTSRILSLSAAAICCAASLTSAQQVASARTSGADDSSAAPEAAAPAPKKAKAPLVRAIDMQYFRAQDQRGVNVFETPKEPGAAFDGFRLSWGAAFLQTFQGLDHRNSAQPVMKKDANNKDYNANELVKIGNGFDNASANLYLNAQLAPGIRVALTTYLSSRHHNETWVKDGFLLIDESPIDFIPLNTLMKYVTVRAGHFEVNYGDAHFRRTDNGNSIYNPFVGNLLMDAFTTEIGAEVYARAKGLMVMGAVTGGEIKGNVTTPQDRKPAYLGKLGVDRQLTPTLRARLTGSYYQSASSPANTLFAGDRAGSPYFFVLENTQATSTAQAQSGTINPGLRQHVTAFQVNPFVKLYGLELFGVAERAKGTSAGEKVDRAWNQYAGEAIYRFAAREQLYVAGRYNTARGALAGIAPKVGADRMQMGAGWYVTPTVLLKGEYVNQKFNDFPSTDIRSGGKFDGFMVAGVVAF